LGVARNEQGTGEIEKGKKKNLVGQALKVPKFPETNKLVVNPGGAVLGRNTL